VKFLYVVLEVRGDEEGCIVEDHGCTVNLLMHDRQSEKDFSSVKLIILIRSLLRCLIMFK